MRPEGRFGVPIDPAASRVFAAFAAGSGITPVLSIMKTVLLRETGSRFFLFFGNRATRDIMFRDEIEDLKDRFCPGCRCSTCCRASSRNSTS